MSQTVVFLTILGMALVTFLPRLLPALWLPSRRIPPPLRAWLRHVPIAVLAALLGPGLLLPRGELALEAGNLYLWAALICGLVAWRTKSLWGTVATGVATVALARLVLGG